MSDTVNANPLNIQDGDVVQLKSGGPAMTVTNVGKTTVDDRLHVWCAWFEGTKEMKGTFLLAAVQRYD